MGRVRRPRIYSVHGMPFIQGVDGRIVERQMMRNQEYQIPAIHIDTERPPVDRFLAPGAKKGENELEPFPTLTRPQVRTSPPEMPAGLDQCSAKAVARWKGDGYRLQPYTTMSSGTWCATSMAPGSLRLKSN